jgi:phospholipid transport system substrate-binding protein
MLNGFFQKVISKRNARMALLAACVVASTVCVTVAQAQVSASGKATIEKVSNLFSVWTTGSSQSVSREAAQFIDYDEMSEKAMGTHWGRLNPTERKQFTATLQHIIEQKYYKRWHKVFAKGELAYKSESPVDGDLFVRTALKMGAKNDVLIWHLSNRTGNYKVISIAVNKKDLLDRLSTRLDARLKKKESFQQLLAWMRDESDIDDDKGINKSHAVSSLPQKS